MFLKSNSILFFLSFYLVGLSGCSSKSKPITETTVDAVTPAPAAPTTPRYFFAEIHILVETTPDGICADTNKISATQISPWELDLTDRKKISSKTPIKKFGVNADLELIGFDSAKYQFSSLDGIIPQAIPFQIRMRRLPGATLEFSYLDQTVQVKMMGSPVYTFAAVEKRGDCTINHNINIFTDRAGLFELE